MDIAELSMVNQANVQEYSSKAVVNTATDTGNEHDKKMINKIYTGSIDPNLGQSIDIYADEQMEDKEELNKQLQLEMKWAQERQKLLNIKEVKLLQMREIAEQGKQVVVTQQELRKLNHRLDVLAAQVSSIDSDMRRTKDGKKLE